MEAEDRGCSAQSLPSTGQSHTDQSNDGQTAEKEKILVDRRLVPIPPDGGYGWMIVFACFCCNTIVEGCVGSFGVFLPHLSSGFGSTKAKTTVAGSFLIGGFLTSGPLASGLVNCFGCRSVTIFGSILTVVAFTLSTQSPNIDVFIFVYGFLGGFGLALVYLPAMVMVGYYFERRRSLATGIAYSGAGVGMVVMPPVAALLLGEFDWGNALIILSAFPLQGIALGGLMRPLKPPDISRVESPKSEESQEEHRIKSPLLSEKDVLKFSENDVWSKFCDKTQSGRLGGSSSEGRVNPVKTQSMISIGKIQHNKDLGRGAGHRPQHNLSPQSCLDLPFNSVARERTMKHHGKTTHFHGMSHTEPRFISCQEISNLPDEEFSQIDSENLQNEISKPLSRRDIFYAGSIKRLSEFRSQPSLAAYVASVTLIPRTDMMKPASAFCPCVSKSTTATLREMFHLGLFLDPYFAIICISSVFIQLGYFVPIVFISDYAISHNTTEAKASLLISIFGIANIFGRAGGGALGSLRRVNELHLNNISLYLAGIATLMLTLFTNYTLLAIYAAVLGLSVGAFVPLTTVFLVRYLGLQHLNNSMGLLSFVKGISSTIGPPIAGVLLDSYGSHVPVFYFAGAMFLTAGSSFYLLGVLDRYRPRKDPEEDS